MGLLRTAIIRSFSRLVTKKQFKPKLPVTDRQYIEPEVVQPEVVQKRKAPLTFKEKKALLEQEKKGKIYEKIRKKEDILAMSKGDYGLPNGVLQKARVVFNKFSAGEVREMGSNYMKLYQLTHANERPFDYS